MSPVAHILFVLLSPVRRVAGLIGRRPGDGERVSANDRSPKQTLSESASYCTTDYTGAVAGEPTITGTVSGKLRRGAQP